MPKLEIYNLILEVTRKCNMNCKHCLRGDTQNIDMEMKTIIPILEITEHISSLVFSGGEPTLNIPLMYDVLHYVKKHDIPVDSFYIVTNGKVISDEFLKLLLEWYIYTIPHSPEPDMSGIALSKDIFHEDIPYENELKLRAFSFFKEDKITNWEEKQYSLIDQGRASKLSKTAYKIWTKPSSHQLYVDRTPNENFVIDDEIYISAKGEICGDCDLSYANMTKHAVGNTNDIESFLDYLKTHAN